MPDQKVQQQAYNRTDPVPEFRSAGVHTVQPESQSVHKALQPDPAPEKTLPQNFKYSDALKYEPGRIQVHAGYFGQNLGSEGEPYGRPNECRASDSKVHQMLNPPVPSKFQDNLEAEKCKLYHSHIREPQGQSYNHGLYVPAHCKEPDYRFGCFTERNEWGAKELTMPPDDPDEGNSEHHRMYVLSHGSYDTAEQRQRGYDWNKIGVHPAEFKFGKTEEDRVIDGVKNALDGDNGKDKRSATIIQKTVTDFKAFNQDHLGKVKHLGTGLHGLADEHSFGMSTIKAPTEWGTMSALKAIEQLRNRCQILTSAERSSQAGETLVKQTERLVCPMYGQICPCLESDRWPITKTMVTSQMPRSCCIHQNMHGRVWRSTTSLHHATLTRFCQ